MQEVLQPDVSRSFLHFSAWCADRHKDLASLRSVQTQLSIDWFMKSRYVYAPLIRCSGKLNRDKLHLHPDVGFRGWNRILWMKGQYRIPLILVTPNTLFFATKKPIHLLLPYIFRRILNLLMVQVPSFISFHCQYLPYLFGFSWLTSCKFLYILGIIKIV